jgi:predicted nucleic acid-binding Zn finger protein
MPMKSKQIFSIETSHPKKCKYCVYTFVYKNKMLIVGSNRKLMLDLDFCAGTDFLLSTVLSFKNSKKNCIILKQIVRDPQICTQLSLILTFLF